MILAIESKLWYIDRMGCIYEDMKKFPEYGKWERQFLPSIGTGVLIVSTSKGIMSHLEAKNQNTGGKLLGYAF